LVDAYADADPAAVKKPKLAVKKAEDRVAELAIKAEAADPLAARHIGSRPFRGRARPRADRGATTGGRAGDRRMAQAVRDLVAADKAWHGVSAQVTQLLAHVPNASVRCDAAGDYG
jgi:hypothetical protein